MEAAVKTIMAAGKTAEAAGGEPGACDAKRQPLKRHRAG